MGYSKAYYAKNRETILAKEKARCERGYKKRKRTLAAIRYRADPERCKAVNKARREAINLACYEVYGKSKCACCGLDDVLFLTLDHTDKKHKDKHRGLGLTGHKLCLYLFKRKFPRNIGVQVLCFNCNCGRARNGGICPHRS